MTEPEVRRLLGGPPLYRAVELGIVRDARTYAINPTADRADLRRRGYSDYLHEQWSSPELSLGVIFDAGGRVACRYQGEGQQRMGPLARLWARAKQYVTDLL